MVTQTCSAHGSLSVNQVESAFMPLRSMLLPSPPQTRWARTCLELRVVRIACFQGPLHDDAPSQAAIPAALD